MIADLALQSFYRIFEVLALGIVGALIMDGFRTGGKTFEALSSVFIKIALPCLMFQTMVTKFAASTLPMWWLFPLLGIGQVFIGGSVAYLYTKYDRSIKHRGVFSTATAFHNSVLLPLAFAPALFTGDALPRFLNLLFLYNLLIVPSFFTIGLWMVHSAHYKKIGPGDIINPPVVATLLGIVFALAGWGDRVSGRILMVFESFGSLATPLSILIVGGAIVNSFVSTASRGWKDALSITVLKSIVLPVLTIAAVFLFRPPKEIAFFLVMGSVMPVGSIVAVIIPDDQDDRRTVAGSILLTNLASIAAIPLFFSLYGLLYGW